MATKLTDIIHENLEVLQRPSRAHIDLRIILCEK